MLYMVNSERLPNSTSHSVSTSSVVTSSYATCWSLVVGVNSTWYSSYGKLPSGCMKFTVTVVEVSDITNMIGGRRSEHKEPLTGKRPEHICMLWMRIEVSMIICNGLDYNMLWQ